ncbi:unnamed protein product [Gordionus sp. m RMFG-2023]
MYRKLLKLKIGSLNISKVNCYITNASLVREEDFGNLNLDESAIKNNHDLSTTLDSIEAEKLSETNKKFFKKNSPYWYMFQIRKLINTKQLDKALEMFEITMIKEDGLPPIQMIKYPLTQIFQILINGCGHSGNLNKAFQLYKKMKEYGLEVDTSVYTSLINSCAECHDKTIGLQKLQEIREHLDQKDIPLNRFLYNSMIKAYGRCGDVVQAFALVDSMKDDPSTKVGRDTFVQLLQACLEDKSNGFFLALKVWKQMKIYNFMPNTLHYNTLLRCLRDCDVELPERVHKKGHHSVTWNAELLTQNMLRESRLLKYILDTRKPASEKSSLSNGSSDNDLAHQAEPGDFTGVIGDIPGVPVGNRGETRIDHTESSILPEEPGELIAQNESLSELIPSETHVYGGKIGNLGNEVHADSTSLTCLLDSSDLETDVRNHFDSFSKKQPPKVVWQGDTDTQGLSNIEKDRWSKMIMLGGLTGLLAKMNQDLAFPDIKTLSLLAEILPTNQIYTRALLNIHPFFSSRPSNLDTLNNKIAAKHVNPKYAEYLGIHQPQSRSYGRIALDSDFFKCLLKGYCLQYSRQYKPKNLENEADSNDEPEMGALSNECPEKMIQYLIENMAALGLSPDISHFGVLAMACKDLYSAQNLLSDLLELKLTPNLIIVTSLMSNACRSFDLSYMFLCLETCQKFDIVPDRQLSNLIHSTCKRIDKAYIRKEYSNKFPSKSASTLYDFIDDMCYDKLFKRAKTASKTEDSYPKFRENFRGWIKNPRNI